MQQQKRGKLRLGQSIFGPGPPKFVSLNSYFCLLTMSAFAFQLQQP